MARIRTIKPDFFRHEDLYELEIKTWLPIRIAFAGLFTVADREGRFKWKPSTIKLDVLPFDEVNMGNILNELWLAGFIEYYITEDGKEFGFIPSFKTHQVINNRESPSNIPEPTKETLIPRVNHASFTRHDLAQVEGKGREGNMERNNMLEKNSSDLDQKKEDRPIRDSDCTPNQISTASGIELDDNSTTVDAESLKKNKKNVAPEKFPFELFWELYGKKRGKAESIRQWGRLSDSDREAVMAYIPSYKIAQPDENFRKDPERFLKKRAWLDEISIKQLSVIHNGLTSTNTQRHPTGNSRDKTIQSVDDIEQAALRFLSGTQA